MGSGSTMHILYSFVSVLDQRSWSKRLTGWNYSCIRKIVSGREKKTISSIHHKADASKKCHHSVTSRFDNDKKLNRNIFFSKLVYK